MIATDRDPSDIRRAADAIARAVTRPWTLMEVCGGQTHAIVRFGLDAMLPDGVTLVHGPGCPVCVTPAEAIDQAIALSHRPGVILCSFGDMMRVPGETGSLLEARARGGDARVVYGPLDAVELARRHPDRQVVFFAVGFETTAPATALAVSLAERGGVANFSILSAHVLVPPAMEALLSAPDNRVQGFLAAGHVCAVMGMAAYPPIAARHRAPIVVTGFEPLDILRGVLMCVRQLESGRAEVENGYARAVQPDGNRAARALIAEVFEAAPRVWRGLGEIPDSGLRLRPAFAHRDAGARFGAAAPGPAPAAASPCIAGAILRGIAKPPDCPAFGAACTPERPLGAPMVSSEGACAAYHRYRADAA
jgi:hydrogenase expression/formation protein HypD